MSTRNSFSTSAGTVTAFAPSVTSASIVVASSDRAGVSIYNNHASANLYVRCGDTAATTTAGGFTQKIAAGGSWETPFLYRGAIQGIWDSGSGNSASVTEYI